jgi:choline dehydrogenase
MNWNFPADQGKSIIGGKTIGGSSSINGGELIRTWFFNAGHICALGHYTRGLAAQYDAWSSLLTPAEKSLNWNWNSLFGYMKKVRFDL